MPLPKLVPAATCLLITQAGGAGEAGGARQEGRLLQLYGKCNCAREAMVAFFRPNVKARWSSLRNTRIDAMIHSVKIFEMGEQ